jgi:SH3-binding glutamic acid-rich protein
MLPRLAVAHSLITNSVEYILRVLQAKNITFNSYDLASDEDAKRLWRRKAPPGECYTSRVPIIRVRTTLRVLDKQQLPGILIGGTCPGVGTINYQCETVHSNAFFAVVL